MATSDILMIVVLGGLAIGGYWCFTAGPCKNFGSGLPFALPDQSVAEATSKTKGLGVTLQQARCACQGGKYVGNCTEAGKPCANAAVAYSYPGVLTVA